MTMETILKTLEAKVEDLVGAYREAGETVEGLRTRISELETQLGDRGDIEDRLAALEKQRDELEGRLSQVLEHIDNALGAND